MYLANKMALVFKKERDADTGRLSFHSLKLVPYQEVEDDYLFDGHIAFAADPRFRALSYDKRVLEVTAAAFYLTLYGGVAPSEVRRVLGELHEFWSGLHSAHFDFVLWRGPTGDKGVAARAVQRAIDAVYD